MAEFSHDVRQAMRALWRAPAFTAAAVLTLTIGVAAMTLALVVFNTLYLQALPYPAADRLAILWSADASRERDSSSYPNFLDWRAQNRSFSDLAAFSLRPFSIVGGDRPEQALGLRVSTNFLATLGVAPSLGRGFMADDGVDGAPAVVLIGDNLWRRQFGARPDVIGRTIRLNDVPSTVVGILPAGFRFPPHSPGFPATLANSPTGVIVPMSPNPSRGGGYLHVVGRLAPGVTLASARENMSAIAARLESLWPGANKGRRINVVAVRESYMDLYRPAFWLLASAVTLLWLIACANVASLMLTRQLARSRETAVRTALGASRFRLLRHLLAETSVLAAMSAVTAVIATIWMLRALGQALALQFPAGTLEVNPSVLAGAVLLGLATIPLAGLAPALALSRPDLADWLRAAGGSLGDRVRQRRLRSLLVVGQTALALLLMIGAGLVARSFIALLRVPGGFDHEQVLTMELASTATWRDEAARAAFADRLLERVRQVPSVETAGLAENLPLRQGTRETFRVEGHADPAPDRGHSADINVVTPGYLEAVRIPILDGRGIASSDVASSAHVIVINETMQRRFWPGQSAIGRHLRFYYDKDPTRVFTIVGVTGDVKARGLRADVRPQVYVPMAQGEPRDEPLPLSLVLRTSVDPLGLAATVQRGIWELDPDQPIADVQTLAQIRTDSIGDTRSQVLLLTLFGGLALALAGVGLYGLLAATVAQRVPEIGVRLALGAEPRAIVRSIVRHGLTLAAAAPVIRPSAAMAATPLIRAFLFDVTPTDTSTYITVALVFLVVAAIASYLPARRAAMLDPLQALRRD
jgi:putative ABC transport system permease protein